MQKLWYWVIVDRIRSGWFEARTPDIPDVSVWGTTEQEVLTAATEIITSLVRSYAEIGEVPPRMQWPSDIDTGPHAAEFSRSLISVDVPSELAKFALH